MRLSNSLLVIGQFWVLLEPRKFYCQNYTTRQTWVYNIKLFFDIRNFQRAGGGGLFPDPFEHHRHGVGYGVGEALRAREQVHLLHAAPSWRLRPLPPRLPTLPRPIRQRRLRTQDPRQTSPHQSRRYPAWPWNERILFVGFKGEQTKKSNG